MVFGELNEAFTFIKTISDWFKRRNADTRESVASRFVKLFEAHGVHRNQIPRFFGHDLTVADVKDDDTLLTELSEQMLNDVADLFAIRREWLDGAEEQVHPTHDFYKNPAGFSEFIDSLVAANPEHHLRGVVVASEENGFSKDPAILILQETVRSIGDKPIYRFHVCNNWAFTYWKARGYLTACVAIAWKREAYVHGVFLPFKEIERLADGKVLLGWNGEGIWELGRKGWDPEDMALYPDAYLKRVDPELEEFGIRSGLQLWLDLESEGFMDVGLNKRASQLFEQELEKQSRKVKA